MSKVVVKMKAGSVAGEAQAGVCGLVFDPQV
jgi:hypothetical protein